VPVKTLVVAILAPCKEYCLPELLASLQALEAADRFLLAVDGELSEAGTAAVVEFHQAHSRRVTLSRLRVPPGPYLYRCGQLRQAAWETFRGMNFGRLLWLDADVLAEPDTIPRLAAHGAPLASGLLMSRTGPTPLLANPGQVLHPGAQETEGGSFGCLLVEGDLARAQGWAEYLTLPPERAPGEDVWWFRRVRETRGARLLLDADVRPWHVDSTGIAGRAMFDSEGRLRREVELKVTRGRQDPGEALLVPWVDGESPRFGRLVAGQPITHHADGTPLTEADKARYAAESILLELVVPKATTPEAKEDPVEP